MQSMSFIQQWKQVIPDWLETYPEILGLVSLEEQTNHNFTVFLPILTFFISSVYVIGQLKLWDEEDKKIHDDIKQLAI